jgi:hypothetical protein
MGSIQLLAAAGPWDGSFGVVDHWLPVTAA